MLSEPEIVSRIESILLERLGVTRTLRPEMELARELELDSIARLVLVTEIENSFRFCFEPDDEAALKTLGDLIRVIQAKAGEVS
jgi:acyl carrier protein